MEGPSLTLASEQLISFKGKTIRVVSGNTKIGKERLQNKKVLDIFSWGKHLVMQFDDFAMRTHFMLFGTFEAVVDGVPVTGDYKRTKEPRLRLEMENGTISMFNCSIKFIESANAKAEYDFSIDIMSLQWDPKRALAHMHACPEETIDDVLLDQEIFAGVGNIIKNEVLWIVKIHPQAKIAAIPLKKRKEIITVAQSFSHQFLAWRREFLLKKHLQIYRKSACPIHEVSVVREKTGKRERWSYWCPICQPLQP